MLLDHFRRGPAGTHTVDANVVVNEVQSRTLGQYDHPSLGGRVDSHIDHTHQTGLGADVDDNPASSSDHLRDRVLHTQENAQEIHVDDAMPICFGSVHDVARPKHTGVVDEDIDSTVGIEGRLDHVLYIRRLGDIRCDKCGPSAFPSDEVDSLVTCFGIEVSHNDRGPLPGETDSSRLANARA